MKEIRPKVKLWFATDDSEGFFGEGKCRLLREIKANGSLSAAAEELNISYRKAWGDLKKAEQGLGVKLIDKTRGGKNGGQTFVTEEGENLMESYMKLRNKVQETVKEFTKKTKAIKASIAVLAIFLICAGCGNHTDKANKSSDEQNLAGKLVIFHAGSLSVPFKEIAKEFNKEHPDVKVLLEASGSRTCARKITDLKRPCDVMASADYIVINQLLIPEFADWNIKFAANEMTVVYNAHSRRANEITADNWTDVLLDEKVAFGRSDPNADPCGYRAVLTAKLAELYSGKTGLADQLLEKDVRYIRPKETDLLALLESNTIDYIFLYRSVAQQHGLKFLILPDQVNLKSADHSDLYSTVSVQISGKKPGEFITKTGAPMVYGLTIPKNSLNPSAALAFVEFVLNKERGRVIMAECGQPSVVPSKSETFDAVPAQLKKYVKE